MTVHFPPRLRMMSHLDRWGLMPMIFPDKVASHSWFVAVYSWMIADLLEWEGDRTELLICALLHDVGEIVTGEFCWPVKETIDPVKADKFIGQGLERQAPAIDRIMQRSVSVNAVRIIKAADRLDACFVAAKEMAFGNKAMAQRMPSCVEQLRDYWAALPFGDLDSVELWRKFIEPSINAHAQGACYDFGG